MENEYWDGNYWNPNPVLDEQDGHEPTRTDQAVSGETPIKRAVQRLVRGNDGRLHVSYIDLSNFKYVRDPLAEGYQVVNPANTQVEVTSDGTLDGDVVSVEQTRPGEDVITPTENDHLQGLVTETPSNIPGASGTIGTPNEIDRYNNAIEAGIRQGTVSPSFTQGGTVATTNPTGIVSGPSNSTLRAEASFTDRARTPDQSDLSHGVVSSNTRGLPAYSANYGQHRPNAPNQGLIDNVRTSVGNVFGPDASVTGISGMGNYGSHRHRKGDALDFDVVDPAGNRVTNPVAMNDVAMDFAARNPKAGVGYGQGYMTTEDGQPGRMHLDTANDPNAWGKDGKSANIDSNLKGNIDFARETGIGPTPTFGAPTPTAKGMDPGPATATGMDLSPTEHKGVFGQIGPNTSPAAMAAQGFTKRTDREIAAISKTIAGELSPSSLGALAAGDPKAARELANMVTSIENRAASQRFGSLEDTLTPSQYNSLDQKNMNTTLGNFQKYGNVIGDKVKGYYQREIKPDSYDFTHYYNPSIVEPDWGPAMDNVVDAGEHRFGSLPDVSPSSGFRSDRARMSEAQAQTDRGFTPSSSAGAFAGRDADTRGTFGSSRSPGVGRSDFSGGRSASPSSGGSPGGRAGGVGSPGVGGGFSGGPSGGGFAPGGSNTSHPGAGVGHGYSPGGAGGHTGANANDRGGFAGL